MQLAGDLVKQSISMQTDKPCKRVASHRVRRLQLFAITAETIHLAVKAEIYNRLQHHAILENASVVEAVT